MCGLTGILIGKKYNREELEKVKDLFTKTLLAHEERGEEATGVIAIRPGGVYTVLKRPVRAREFVETGAYIRFLKKWDKNVCTVLGHTRKPTKGSVWNGDNNHPVIVGNIVGIHNGTIKNDEWLFKNENLNRKGEVDSEVIFSMLNSLNGSRNFDSLARDIQRCTGKLSGSFTTLSVNLKYPHEMLLLKYNQPLSFHFSKSLRTLFFTSRYIFLRKAFGRSVVTEALPSKMGYIFSLYSRSGSHGKPMIQFPISSFDEKKQDECRA